ncbi:hypothetical protein HNR62_002637 [Oceanisphaera litoralis]|uniref:hypothetical protein n=1 Tax=Oceanisphaera litoralis TaxID=225144 RepID=UPI00195A88E1|nr:hypothetical protein [Oceanisphaera litoralis]MBM7456735.1 hypothetical protein [Oceanisphaera litoralis]
MKIILIIKLLVMAFVLSGCSSSVTESFLDTVLSKHRVETICNPSNLECTLSSEQYGDISLTCNPDYYSVPIKSSGLFSTSKFILRGGGVVRHIVISKNGSDDNFYKAMISDKPIMFYPPNESIKEIVFDRGELNEIDKLCRGEFAERQKIIVENNRLLAIKKRQEKEDAERAFQNEIKKIATRYGVKPLKERLEVTKLVMSSNLLANKNIAFASYGARLYKVKQALNNNTYLVIADHPWVATNTMPLMIKSSKTLYEGTHIHNFIGVYHGVTTYRTIRGSTKQAAKITIVKEL